MTETIRDADLRGLLDLLDAGRSGAEAEGLPLDVLNHAHALIDCDSVSFIDFDLRDGSCSVEQSVPANEPSATDPDEGAFWRNYADCAACSRPDGRGVTTTSDFYTMREYHETGMYREYLGPLGVERGLMVGLTAPHGRARRLLFFRGAGPDFDGRARLLMALLRPHIVELYAGVERRRRGVPDLTPRQWELLSLVANGHSNRQIARALVISPTTVRTHLENIYARLGVSSRTAAVAASGVAAY